MYVRSMYGVRPERLGEKLRDQKSLLLTRLLDEHARHYQTAPKLIRYHQSRAVTVSVFLVHTHCHIPVTSPRVDSTRLDSTRRDLTRRLPRSLSLWGTILSPTSLDKDIS